VLLVANPRERQARDGLLKPIAGRVIGHVADVRRHAR
jgi:hypothetical protein